MSKTDNPTPTPERREATDLAEAWIIVQRMIDPSRSPRWRFDLHQVPTKPGYPVRWQASFEIEDGRMRMDMSPPHVGDFFATSDSPADAIRKAAAGAEDFFSRHAGLGKVEGDHV